MGEELGIRATQEVFVNISIRTQVGGRWSPVVESLPESIPSTGKERSKCEKQ